MAPALHTEGAPAPPASRPGRWLTVSAALLTSLALAACGGGGDSGGRDAGAGGNSTDGGSSQAGGTISVNPAPPPARPASAPATRIGPDDFQRVEPLLRIAGVIREKVSYRSGSLTIVGQICRPDATDARYPILMVQHAGFSGLRDEWNGLGFCQYMADRGYAVFMSSYRGEDGSDGEREYCLGEVDDSLALLAIARRQPYVQAARAGLLGVSHGGCVSLQMLARGAQVQALVDVIGPTDWAALYRLAASRIAAGQGSDDDRDFIDTAGALIGSPDANPQAYRARSPLYSAAALRDWPGALLVVQGARDEVVAPSQACDLVRALGGFRNTHLDSRYLPRLFEFTTSRHPPECGDPVMTWTLGEHPGVADWPGQRHFVFYDQMSHTSGAQLLFAIDDATNFLRVRFPGGPQ